MNINIITATIHLTCVLLRASLSGFALCGIPHFPSLRFPLSLLPLQGLPLPTAEGAEANTSEKPSETNHSSGVLVKSIYILKGHLPLMQHLIRYLIKLPRHVPDNLSS